MHSTCREVCIYVPLCHCIAILVLMVSKLITIHPNAHIHNTRSSLTILRPPTRIYVYMHTPWVPVSLQLVVGSCCCRYLPRYAVLIASELRIMAAVSRAAGTYISGHVNITWCIILITANTARVIGTPDHYIIGC